jgi:hypothetical protein
LYDLQFNNNMRDALTGAPLPRAADLDMGIAKPAPAPSPAIGSKPE